MVPIVAWSIGGATKRSHELKPVSHFVPGPGQYQPKKEQKQRPTSIKIGNASKVTSDETIAPGPGRYEQVVLDINHPSLPKYKFVYKLPGEEKPQSSTTGKSTQPGPGTYEPIKKQVSQPPSYSFGYKGTDPDPYQTPGAADYPVDKLNPFEKRPASRIGKAKRTDFNQTQNVPGVGSYEVSRPLSSGPRYRFGNGNRDREYLDSTKAVPGPGAYEIKTNMENNNGKTLISRRPQSSYSNFYTPGPGTYHWDKLKTSPAFRIGSGSRSNWVTQHNPGPGQYSPKSWNRPGSSQYRIGSSTRPPLNPLKDTPGPGNYDIDRDLKGPKYFMAGKKPKKDSNENPGPGTYDGETWYTSQKGPAHIIGTQARQPRKKLRENPGPGHYELNRNLGGELHSFGKGKKSSFANDNDEENPGPGAYKSHPFFARMCKYKIRESTGNKSDRVANQTK